MKKLIFSITLVLFSISLSLTAASAAFDEAYMSVNNTTTPKVGDYIYGVEQPWFYVQFSDLDPETVIGTSSNIVKWSWEHANATQGNYIKYSNTTENGVWGTLEEWNSAEQLGNWTITIMDTLNATPGSGASSGLYAKTLKFTVSNVVPEPASVLLYILGGGSLIAGFLRKKKA
jgi:hypothetical protein